MDLNLLDEVVRPRSEGWTAQGAVWRLVRDHPSPAPASWLVLEFGTAAGQLTVWEAGDAEVQWKDGTTFGTVHYSLQGPVDLTKALSDFEAALGLDKFND